MKTVYKFKVISLMLYLTACGGSGGGGTAVQSAPTPDPNQPGIVAPNPQTTSLTYYTLVKNATISQGGNSYPLAFTGHCVVYESNDYCWDDGWQTVAATGYFNSFWQLCELNGVVGQCHGNGSIDPVDGTPTLWTQMAAKLPTPPSQPVTVYTQGIPTPVTCTVTGTIVDCVDFQIDTALAPL